LRDGISKEPVKRLAAQFVGREAIYNPKRGFGVPIQDWFRQSLGDHLREMLRDPNSDAGAFFDTKALQHNLDHGLKSVNQAFQLWVVYNFLHWQQELTRLR
jgi:asparagine synthase (glutamine-hydrolysing)